MATTVEELQVLLTLRDNATAGIAAVRTSMDGVAAAGAAASDATDTLAAASAGASAAAAKLAATSTGTAAAVNVQDQVMTRASVSADRLLRAADPLEKMNSAIAVAANRFAREQATANSALAAGAYTQEQYATVIEHAQKKQRDAVASATDAYNASQLAAGRATVALDHNADAADRAAGAHAGFYREVLVLGHEMVTGNYNRIPGSLMVLAERTGNLEDLAKRAFSALTSVPGVIGLAATAGVAMLADLAVRTEDAALRTERLSNQLRATRTDYQAMAATVETAAKLAASEGLGSIADTRSAAQIIGAVPTFAGNATDLDHMLALSKDVAAVWNLTLPDAAKRLADAMADPLTAAKALAKDGFTGMSAASLELIRRLAEAGDIMGAQRAVLAAYAAGVEGAHDNLTPFEQSLRNLNDAFTTGANAGRIWGQTIGEAVLGIAGAAVDAVAQMKRAATNAGPDVATAAAGITFEFAPQAADARRPVGGGFPHSATPFNAIDAARAAQTKLLDQADAASGGGNSLAALRDQIALLQAAQAAVGDNTEKWQQYQDKIDADRLAIEHHNDALTKQGDLLNKQSDLILTSILGNNRLADAYLHGTDAVLAVTAAEKARQEAIRLFPKDLTAQADATERLTGLYHDQAAAEADVKAAQDAVGLKEQLEVINKETSLLGASNEVRAHELAILKERQKLLHDNANLDSAASQAALQYAGQVADASAALQHQQQIISDLTGMATQAFDQVGNAIAQAFTLGAGHAVNFANVMKAAMASVLQEIAKLAIINPVLNGIIGGGRSTLGDVAGLLGSGANIGSLSGLSGLSGVGLWGATGASAGASALYGGGLAAGGAGSVTLGSLAGGAGLGFGASLLLNGLLGGNQTGGTIGGAGGALAGAAIGSIVPGVGTLIGGLIGGAAGGGLGGLFGPGSASHGWSVDDVLSGGRLAIGGSGFDKFNGASILTGLQQQNAAINALADQYGLSIGLAGGKFKFGGSRGQQDASNSQFFGALNFSAANDNALNGALSGRQFGSTAELQNFLAFFQGSYESLVAAGTATSAYDKQLKSINDSYSQAITQARAYGLATDTLASAQAAAVQALKDQQLSGVNNTVGGLVSFAASLSTGNASPLSPIDILSAARSTFSGDASAALGGDLAALGRIQGDAATFLSASRTVNGSGAGYVSDFSAVINALQAVTKLTPDTLTASVVRQTAQTQTDQLLAAFASLNQQVVLLRQQVGISNGMPARLAA